MAPVRCISDDPYGGWIDSDSEPNVPLQRRVICLGQDLDLHIERIGRQIAG